MSRARLAVGRFRYPTQRTFLGVWFLMALACVADEQPSDREPFPAVEDTLTAEPFAFSTALARPNGIVVDGPRIWVSDYAGNPELHVFSAASGELIVSLGRRGDGSGEFRGNAGEFQTLPDDTGVVWVFAPAGQRVVRVDDDLPSTEWRAVALEIPPYVMRLVWIDAATAVGITSTEDPMFVAFDSLGTRIQATRGRFPGPEVAPVQERMKAGITAFGICPKPTGEGFIRYHHHFGRVDSFGRDAAAATLFDVPFPSEPIFDTDREGRPRFTPEQIHYVGCAIGDSHYYLVYSGLPIDLQHQGADAGSHIHIFDNDGRLYRVMHLDSPVSKIAVDESGGWLYGNSDEEGGVYRFRLPKDLTVN